MLAQPLSNISLLKKGISNMTTIGLEVYKVELDLRC